MIRLKLKEALGVKDIRVGFKSVLPSGTNYVDSHQALPVFGTRWGRYILVYTNGRYEAIFGSYGVSHAQLKKSLQLGERSAGTGYWGYDSRTKILYFQYGADATYDFDDRRIISALFNGLKNSNTAMKGMRILQESRNTNFKKRVLISLARKN